MVISLFVLLYIIRTRCYKISIPLQAYGEERQAVSRVREAEKESEAVRHNQTERRQYLAAGKAAGT